MHKDSSLSLALTLTLTLLTACSPHQERAAAAPTAPHLPTDEQAPAPPEPAPEPTPIEPQATPTSKPAPETTPQLKPEPELLTKLLGPDQCNTRDAIPRRYKPEDQRWPRYIWRGSTQTTSERVIFSSNTHKKTAPSMYGEAWSLSARGLEPAQPAPDHATLARFAHPQSDSFTRAIYSPRGALSMTLMLRLQPGQDPAMTSGYGLRLEGAQAQLVRLDQGKLTALTEPQLIYKLEDRRTLEVMAWTLGPDLLVQLHDGDSGVELLHLHARDSTYASGELGLLSEPKHTNPKQATMTLLTSRAACDQTPPPHTEHKGTIKPPRSFITLPKRLALPDKSAARLMERLPESNIYEVTNPELERIFCHHKTSPTAISTEIPWKYIDDDYLLYRQEPPVLHQGQLRVDLSYKNPRMVEELLRAFHARYPAKTQLKLIGHSRQGRPILAMVIANDIKTQDPRPAILLNAAHHGDEPLSTEIAFGAIDYLLQRHAKDVEVQQWLDQLVIWIIPQVNPDGALAHLEQSWRTGRKNGHDLNHDGVRQLDEGVDLNRNYPFRWASLPEGSSPEPEHPHYRGPKPASEPETQAIMAVVERERFLASISYHTGTVCILAPYTIDGVKAPSPNEAWTIAEQISQLMPINPEGRTFKVRRNLYPVDGTDQDWMRHEHGTLALLVEAVRYSPRQMCPRRGAAAANEPSWVELLRRTIKGPTLVGTLTDDKGAPVQAPIMIKEQTLNQQEQWGTRPRDGLFNRYLSTPGTYTIEIDAPGFEPYQRQIKIDKGISNLKIVLSPEKANDRTPR